MPDALTRNWSAPDEAYARQRIAHLLRGALGVPAKTGVCFFAALHETRGRQAARFVHDHRHLISGK